MVDPLSALFITMFLFVVSSLSALRCALVRLSFFCWICFSSRILWMNVSRLLLPQLVSMYFGGLRAGRIGSVFCFLSLFLIGV